MFKTQIQKIIDSDYFPFVILALGMLIIHIILRLNVGDDKNFYGSILQKISLLGLLRDHYLYWSSRLIIESVLVMILQLPLIVWRIADTAVMVLLGVTISRLVVTENKRASNWLITLLLFIYPLLDMGTAGWVTTTLNYLWVLTFGLFTLIPVKKALLGQKTNIWEYVLAIGALIFAVNQEQMCMVLLVIYLVATIYLVALKRPNWFVFFGFTLCVASIIFIITCPGNASRLTLELKWFEDFNHISVINKLQIGFSSTFAQYIFTPNLVFVVFCLLLYFSVKNKYIEIFYQIFSIIPLFVSLFFGFFIIFAPELFPNISKITSQMTDHGLITLNNFTFIDSYIALIILCTTMCLVLISVYLVFENTWNSICIAGILLLGFLSRIVVSFSPTIWASDTRTFIFMYGSLIICSVLLFQHIIKSGTNRFTEKILTFIGFVAVISCLNLLMASVIV